MPSFIPMNVELFMGGDFTVGHPQTVGALRRVLTDMEKELATWGDEEEIVEVFLDRRGKITVTLKRGIPNAAD